MHGILSMNTSVMFSYFILSLPPASIVITNDAMSGSKNLLVHDGLNDNGKQHVGHLDERF